MNTLLTSQRALLQALFGAASDAEALKTLTTDHAMPTPTASRRLPRTSEAAFS